MGFSFVQCVSEIMESDGSVLKQVHANYIVCLGDHVRNEKSNSFIVFCFGQSVPIPS